MKSRPVLREGQRVILKANEKEGWPREEGVVEGIGRKWVTVRVDEKYRDEDDFDGLREVTRDQLEAAR